MNPAPEPRGQPPAGGEADTANVFAGYAGASGLFDEMVTMDGVIRPHWQPLCGAVSRSSAETFGGRREDARQLLREHGVTYNVSSDGHSAERTWELDLLPLIIDAAEWAVLEAGLIQRTRLLNLVLNDLYGPQRLLVDGLLPSALLQANPGFLRPCHNVQPPRGQFLTLHAVDLTRAPDGRWWVFADRTQAPSGVGYALENRTIISRVLEEEFRAAQVRQLAPFFAARKEGLRAMVPWTDEPSMALLTPGPLSETYFEHAYIARFLGIPLVEGSDLTVRGQRVFLKTLDGLKRVDVIVRRVDDTYCDPLELRGDSLLGVPGLVEATRAGHVAISNALGAGAVEAPALLAFLPALARRLLGEELLLPNAATWWCGQRSEREYALEHLATLVVKHSFTGGPVDPIFGQSLSAAQRAEVAARIAADPHNFLAQERVALSTVPVWTGRELQPRPLILRCFVCATANGYAVLPGGLTRVSARPDSPVVSSKEGGGSKDTWVLSATAWSESAAPPGAVSIGRAEKGSAPAPSRAAENLFWLGRYAERLEDSTRLLRTLLGRLAGEGAPSEERELAAFTPCVAERGTLPRATYPSRRVFIAELREAVFGERAGTVRELLRRVSFRTANVRDRLSGDTWRILNHLQTEFPATPVSAGPAGLLSTLHRVIAQLAAFSGMELENMLRDDAWRFLDLGRRIERASNLLATVRAVLAADLHGGACLPPLLDYTDSAMSYRRRFFARPELPQTLDLLLAEEKNPRSLAFNFKLLGHHLRHLPGNEEAAEARLYQDMLEHAATAVRAATEGLTPGDDAEPLDRLLLRLGGDLWDLSDLLTGHYFSHVPIQAS